MRRWRTYILMSLLIGFNLGCSDLFVTEPAVPDNEAEFDAAWEAVNSVYPFFEYKRIDWDSLKTLYRPGAAAAKGDEIEDVLGKMLLELRDGHVSLQTRSGAVISRYNPPRVNKDRNSYSPLVVRKYFDEELKLSGDRCIEYGILGGNIGYVYIATLLQDEPILSGFDEALAFVKDTKGLIVDERHDMGGSDNNSAGIVGRFLASPMENLSSSTKDHGVVQGSPIPPRGPFQYDKPVVLLINGVCFSSGEDFAEMMKHVPTVTLVGDTTAGASGAPQLFTLPSGRRINVSTKSIRRYDGMPIEWNGVLPDVLVQQSASDIEQGVDRQLEYAIQMLR